MKVIIVGIDYLPSSIPEKIFLDRLDIWKQVANHIMQNFYTYKFWIGEGFQATEYVVKMSSNDNIAYMLPTIAHAHNFFLQIWLEFGVVGVLLSSFIILRFFRWMLIQSKEKQPYLFGSFVIIFSALNVNFSLTETWFVTTCILSIFITRNIFLNHIAVKELAN